VKIAAPEKAPRRQLGPPQPPIGLDDLGMASLILNAPTAEAAWHALTDGGPANGAYLVARLTATSSRVDEATAAVAKGLAAIKARRDAGRHVPESWVDRLAELSVAEFDALVAWDDAANQASVEPRWVEGAGGTTNVDRMVRVLARAQQAVAGLTDPDRAWDRLGGLDPAGDLDEAGVEEAKARARELIRWAVGDAYGEVVAC
jgi:hypothetical protein